MSFELTFLGTSGGPQETGNCSLMIKPAAVSYADVLAASEPPLVMIDAGSGLNALAELIADPVALATRQSAWYPDALAPQTYLSVAATRPFAALAGCPFALSRRLLQKVAATLLTHPHLDHISALVLNSPALLAAHHKLQVYGMPFTTHALKTHIFNGVVWPDLASLQFLEINTVPDRRVFSVGGYSVTAFELSHGHTTHADRTTSPYCSSAFLVADASGAKMLVCGDFEADAVSGTDRNLQVWRQVAAHVADGSLRALVLECSSCDATPDAELYGHMTPAHLFAELQTLRRVCGAPLTGLHVIVAHIKDTFDGQDPRRKIWGELQHLNDASGLGVAISVATNGLSVIV